MTTTLSNTQIVTTDEVLSEVLTFFAGQGQGQRQRAVQLVQGIFDNPNIVVIHQTHDSFVQGFQLYQQRPDKGYSLPDCISMNTMHQLNIRYVLTHDKHFAQEGFDIVFNDGP